eukprot:4298179-Prymnesium_polylepis.1
MGRLWGAVGSARMRATRKTRVGHGIVGRGLKMIPPTHPPHPPEMADEGFATGMAGDGRW